MGSSLEFKVGGRIVSKDQFFDNMKSSAIDLATDAIKSKVEAVRCPAHGSAPSDVKQARVAGGDLKLTYSACCPELRAAVEGALSRE